MAFILFSIYTLSAWSGDVSASRFANLTKLIFAKDTHPEVTLSKMKQERVVAHAAVISAFIFTDQILLTAEGSGISEASLNEQILAAFPELTAQNIFRLDSTDIPSNLHIRTLLRNKNPQKTEEEITKMAEGVEKSIQDQQTMVFLHSSDGVNVPAFDVTPTHVQPTVASAPTAPRSAPAASVSKPTQEKNNTYPVRNVGGSSAPETSDAAKGDKREGISRDHHAPGSNHSGDGTADPTGADHSAKGSGSNLASGSEGGAASSHSSPSEKKTSAAEVSGGGASSFTIPGGGGRSFSTAANYEEKSLLDNSPHGNQLQNPISAVRKPLNGPVNLNFSDEVTPTPKLPVKTASKLPAKGALVARKAKPAPVAASLKKPTTKAKPKSI